MRAFWQSLDEKVWLAFEVGWTKLTDPPMSQDDNKIKATNFNSRALNALFSVVTNEEFKKISSTKSANEAQTILQNTYEGTKAVKDSKLQRLGNEVFNEFYAKLKDIVNSIFNLGEKIPGKKPKFEQGQSFGYGVVFYCFSEQQEPTQIKMKVKILFWGHCQFSPHIFVAINLVSTIFKLQSIQSLPLNY